MCVKFKCIGEVYLFLINFCQNSSLLVHCGIYSCTKKKFYLCWYACRIQNFHKFESFILNFLNTHWMFFNFLKIIKFFNQFFQTLFRILPKVLNFGPLCINLNFFKLMHFGLNTKMARRYIRCFSKISGDPFMNFLIIS
jgi:hypothetical protein